MSELGRRIRERGDSLAPWSGRAEPPTASEVDAFLREVRAAVPADPADAAAIVEARELADRLRRVAR